MRNTKKHTGNIKILRTINDKKQGIRYVCKIGRTMFKTMINFDYGIEMSTLNNKKVSAMIGMHYCFKTLGSVKVV